MIQVYLFFVLLDMLRSFYCFVLVLQGDLAVPDIPKSMAWCENSICVGFKRDYYLIRVRVTGKNTNPSLKLT